MKFFSSAAAAVIILILAAHVEANKEPLLEVPADCSHHLPWGQPTVPGTIQTVCKLGYTSFFDTNAKIPRLVVYRETGPDTLGCLDRLRNFHTERLFPRDNRPSPNDYANSGYDLGHNAPDQDMATTYVRLFDSYNLSNISPQLPGLNRQGWESLEEMVRAWALERGEVVIHVGAILSDTPTVIGRNQVAIPDAFFKVVIDPKTNESIAFILPQKDIPKGDLSPYETTVAEVEKQTGIHFSLPEQTDRDAKPPLWSADVRAWHKAHKIACAGKMK